MIKEYCPAESRRNPSKKKEGWPDETLRPLLKSKLIQMYKSNLVVYNLKKRVYDRGYIGRWNKFY